ncbi:MAG: peptidoglycan editing factor PgeF [Gemmatimonadota bacterium]|nr:MAG: peptidoglycan editing factor PgeF [Gemmatimonadota bacterium]
MSTRGGGVSQGVYGSLNLGFHVGDDNGAVLTNRKRFFQTLSIPFESVVTAQQVHGAEVRVVTEHDCGTGVRSWEEGLPQTDAMVTDVCDVGLLVLVADCAPVLLHDQKRKAVGIAHGSWRGTAEGIARNTVLKMIAEFGCKPENIRAGIGPSIGPCCYRVGEEVISCLKNAAPDIWNNLLIPKGKDTVFLNLWEALLQQLIEAGIQREKIEIAGICTACHTDLFYSHRRENGKTGRNGAIIALRNQEEHLEACHE